MSEYIAFGLFCGLCFLSFLYAVCIYKFSYTKEKREMVRKMLTSAVKFYNRGVNLDEALLMVEVSEHLVGYEAIRISHGIDVNNFKQQIRQKIALK